MYNPTKKMRISMAAEIRAMTAFVHARWSSVEDIQQLFTLIAKVAKENTHGIIDDSDLLHYLQEKKNQRVDILDSVNKGVRFLRHYDQAYVLLDNLLSSSYSLAEKKETLRSAYEPAMKQFSQALKDFPRLKKAQPVGLRKMLANYEKGNEAWETALANEGSDRYDFKGADTATGCHGGFVYAASLIMIVQTKHMHNERPIDILIEGAYSHFISLYRTLNSKSIMFDVDQLNSALATEKPLFKLDFVPQKALTKALLASARENWDCLFGEDDPEKLYNLEVSELKKKKPLSKAESEAAIAATAKKISTMWSKALKSKST